MENNELITKKNNELVYSEEIEKTSDNVYALANIYKVLFARLFDIFISAIPGFIMAWTIKPQGVDDWQGAAINLGAGLFFIILFFVIIPMFLKGNTLGKLIFGIRIKRSKGDKKIKFHMLLARESFFLIIPWVVALTFFIVAIFVMKANKPEDVEAENTNRPGALIIYQLGYIFFLLWFLFVGVSIKVQSEHQSAIDMKFGLFVVYKEPIKKEEQIKIKETLERDENHISLSDMPGNFNDENLKSLKKDEISDFDNSISLDDLDIKETTKLDNNNEIKSIEEKEEE